jgi:molybdate transport system substrate-binding protein
MKKRAGLLLLLLVAGCSDSRGHTRMFVAASLVDLAHTWHFSDTDSVEYHFGASMTLSQQIVAGARADFFVPAGAFVLEHWDFANRVARIDSTFLTNRLVLICRPGIAAPFGLAQIRDTRFRAVALADPSLSPAGRYAQLGLESEGLWDTLNHRWVLLGDVRSVLAAVSSGAADAGFVYATDAHTMPGLKFMELEHPTSFPPAHYPLVMLLPETPLKRKMWDELHEATSRHESRRLGFQ